MASDGRERILVGIDGTDSSMRALQWALRYAERTGAVVDAVHVWQGPPQLGNAAQALPGESYADTAQRALNGIVDGALAGGANVTVRRIAQGGYPADVLVERSKAADLLVVGSRGRSGLTGTFLGSVSLRCVTHASCPVVVVRGED